MTTAPTIAEAEENCASVLKSHPIGTPEAGRAIDWLICAMNEHRKRRSEPPPKVHERHET